jgi:hypothetical protein
MAQAVYRIFGDAEGWTIEHDGKAGGRYELPEAAFEAAISAASLAMKQRNNVTISVLFPEGEKPAGDDAQVAGIPDRSAAE